MAERFYCPGAARGGTVTLDGAEAAHLGRVRRIGAGETVVLFDGEGYATDAVVRGVGRNAVTLETVGPPLPDRRPSLELTLATAVPKGDRLDWLVEKATELGVARLVPVVTGRSVVDPRTSKLDRLRRGVVEASKQCGRNRLMAIEPPIKWADLLRRAGDGVRLLADPSGPPGAPWPTPSPGAPAWLAVGPEGGFTPDERDEAVRAGWTVVGLGPTILRVETAGLVGCARLLAGAETRSEGEAG